METPGGNKRFRKMAFCKQEETLRHVDRSSSIMVNFKKTIEQHRSRSNSIVESPPPFFTPVKRISLEAMMNTKKLTKYLPFSQNKHHSFIGERFLKFILDGDCGKLEQMLKKLDADFNISELNSLVHEACYKGCLKCFQILIKNGVSHDCVIGDENWTPLHAAIMGENEELFRFLIPLYKNVDLVNSNGITPLHVAVYINNLLFVHLLLQASANMFIETQIMTPFQLAIDLKHSTILDYFILYSANHSTIDLTWERKVM
ncbi:serine/threonine-protein phosphatase 6 regulatory ankyrin repeat subunit A [Hydra vulgaris]|uniref:Serine/threonine-protein phosphatase 6 regulatory ankyrin repeat subunit A n=1 Tax=Hydra vulgaris TaxID=6087 RepID=A0ABM4DDS0_HYDVU